MQTITIAIGKAGVQFFSGQFLSGNILALLKNLSAPTRQLSIPDFRYSGAPLSTTSVEGLTLLLTDGQIQQYVPTYQGVTQGSNNGIAVFTLSFASGTFTAQYIWSEAYSWTTVGITGGPRPLPYTQSGDGSWAGNYAPEFSGLLVTVTVQFAFNQAAGSWQISVQDTSGKSTPVNTGIPSQSVLNYQSQSCSGHHFDETTALAIAAIDFSTPLNDLISGVLKSIPDSGDLGNGIVFDFSLGDSGLLFPNNDGIQIGVKGGASYQGTAYPGTPPAALPLPPIPADGDTHHLNIFISGYELSALSWAQYEAKHLNFVVNQADLSDPNELKVKLYEKTIPALKPFGAFAMQAQVVQNAAPEIRFQTVYELTKPVMDALKNQLEQEFYDQLNGLQGNNYLDRSGLEADLNGNAIPPFCYPIIETAAKTTGMVVTHDLNLTIVILNSQPDPPDIVFKISRIDILSDLGLGIGPGKTQTFQFTFANFTWNGDFVSTSVPGLDGSHFPNLWGEVGEPFYDKILQEVGKKGIPLPIMQGFQFDFSNAVLSIQDNYVSILADVQLK